MLRCLVENLSLFALIYLRPAVQRYCKGWESFIIRLDILIGQLLRERGAFRIFHYSPWYTYSLWSTVATPVENLSLFALIYLKWPSTAPCRRWESFIIRLDILTPCDRSRRLTLRIFHYSPWYTYRSTVRVEEVVENLSLFALIYLRMWQTHRTLRWESFIIHLDILKINA